MPAPPKPTLKRDADLRFPEFVLVKASAGSGKTHALSLRFVQFLLSPKIRDATPADLRNILAITFTKNAAREMKGRILGWLKDCYFQNPDRSREVLEILSIPASDLPAESERIIEHILSNYTDLQVETIDSFMAAIFRASSLDLGHSPDFEIVLDNAKLVEYSFQRYLRKVTPTSPEGENLSRIVEYILVNMKDETAFPWDPAPEIQAKLMAIHAKLAAQIGELALENRDEERALMQTTIVTLVRAIEDAINGSGLETNARSAFWSRIKPAADIRHFTELIGASFKTLPVKSPKSSKAEKDRSPVEREWVRLEQAVKAYMALYAGSFFYPYLRAYRSVESTLDDLKRQQEIVFIEDINKDLARYIEEGIIPDIYFRLGDRISHFLIDEFQDTSPIQWANLRPLIENSLAESGSLFSVGDTKQAIYGFRDADYRIMRDLEKPGGNPFPSVERIQVLKLSRNYRSFGNVIGFIDRIFPKKVQAHETYSALAARSGLDDFRQTVVKAHRGLGAANYVLVEKEKDETPEKSVVQERVLKLRERGYAYSDIAILTYKNESVVAVSAWLNEIGVPFIPYSSLDIRKRKISGEIMAFLKFLDSPPDDLSFAVFLLGEIFARNCGLDGANAGPEPWRHFLFECHRTKTSPLYVAFRDRHPDVWARYFEPFFKTAGYSPVYDLVTQVFRVFRLFDLFPDEEASLAKFLEAIKDFEGQGKNDLLEFLEAVRDDPARDSGLNIDVPSDIEAVKIMSIHKAKGLGFPVVILLLYGEKFKPPDFYLHEVESHVRIYKLNRELAGADEDLQAVYDEARAKEEVDRLNTLYVALTRAQVELHVIGVKGERDRFPFDLLGEEIAVPSGGQLPIPSARRPRPSPSVSTLRFPLPLELPPSRRERLNVRNIRRGLLVHEILAKCEYLRAEWAEEIRDIIRDLRPAEPDRAEVEEVGRDIVRFFQDSPLTTYFEPKEGRRVLREFGYCDMRGQVFRLDRAVLDPDAIVVLDFKTGRDRESDLEAQGDLSYHAQMAAYRRILSEVHPGRTVTGILAYIDQGRWEEMS